MGFMWGSFADGFAKGFSNGWDLGDRITTAMDKADFRNSVRGATDKADAALKDLDDEKNRRTGRAEIANTTENPDSAVLQKDALRGAPEKKEDLTALPKGTLPEGSSIPTAMPRSVSTDPEAVEATMQEPPLGTALPGYADAPSQTLDTPQAAEQFRSALPASDREAVRVPEESAMGTDEYMQRRSAILHDRERSILQAQLRYAERDPEKYAEIQKKLYDMDTDDNINMIVAGLQKGDSEAIGIAVKTLKEVGFLPEGSMPRQGKNGSVELVDKEGKVLWGGNITPQMLSEAIPLFAVAAKAKADRNYDKMIEIQGTVRTRKREDAQDDRAERQLKHTFEHDAAVLDLSRKTFAETQRQNRINNTMQALKFEEEKRQNKIKNEQETHKQNVSDWNTYASVYGPGKGKGGSGAGAGAGGPASGWSNTLLPPKSKVVDDPSGATDKSGNPIQIVVNSVTGEKMAIYDEKTRNARPAYEASAQERAVIEEAKKSGWEESFAFDDSGRAKYAIADPKTGRYAFADDPSKVYESREQAPDLPPFPYHGWGPGQNGNNAGATTHTSVGTTRSETEKAQAEEAQAQPQAQAPAPAQAQAPAQTAAIMKGPDVPVPMDAGLPDVPQITPEEEYRRTAVGRAETRMAEIKAQALRTGWTWPLEYEYRQAVLEARRARYGNADSAAPASGGVQQAVATALQGPDVPVAMEGGMPGIPRPAPTSQAGYDPADFYRQYADVKRPPEAIGSHLATDADRAVTARRAASYDRNGPTEYADHEYKYGASRPYGAPISGAEDFYRRYGNDTLDNDVAPTAALHASSYGKGQAGRYQTSEVYDDKKPRSHETAPTTRVKKTAMDDFYDKYKDDGYGHKRGALDPIKKVMDDIEKTESKTAIKWGKTEAEENKESEERIKKFPKILKDAQKPRKQDRTRPKKFSYQYEKDEEVYSNKKFDVSSHIPQSQKEAHKRGSIEYDLAWRMAAPALAELVRNDVDVKKLNPKTLKKLWKTVLHGDARHASDQFFKQADEEIRWCYLSLVRNKQDLKKWAKEEAAKEAEKAKKKYMNITVEGGKIA